MGLDLNALKGVNVAGVIRSPGIETEIMSVILGVFSQPPSEVDQDEISSLLPEGCAVIMTGNLPSAKILLKTGTVIGLVVGAFCGSYEQKADELQAYAPEVPCVVSDEYSLTTPYVRQLLENSCLKTAAKKGHSH